MRRDPPLAFELLGWPEEEPTLSLDHREFAYAGKFEMSSTGKAVLRRAGATGAGDDDGRTVARGVVAAAAFDADRTDAGRLVVRYVTVHRDHRGEGLGPRLIRRLLERADGEGRFERARIAVNNPFAYEALHRAGFAYTGEQTGIAELVLERPVDRPATVAPERYRAGLAQFAERDLDDGERAFVERQRRAGPPSVAGDDRRHDG